MEVLLGLVFVVLVLGWPVLLIAVIVLARKLRRKDNEFNRRLLITESKFTEEAEVKNRLLAWNASSFLEEWLALLPFLEYSNELEVEAKFVAPLLMFLGYRAGDVRLRVPVELQVGSQRSTGQADWVFLRSSSDSSSYQIVLEAKSPGTRLDGSPKDQARSYAFGLNAPMFVVTNGQRLDVYERGVQTDRLILSLEVPELVHRWPEVKEALGNRSRTVAEA